MLSVWLTIDVVVTFTLNAKCYLNLGGQSIFLISIDFPMQLKIKYTYWNLLKCLEVPFPH